jgi:hypothetical protein
VKHVQGKNCASDQEWKNKCIEIMKIKSTRKVAWLKSLGTEAIADSEWYISVLSGDTDLDSWSFSNPRLIGVQTSGGRGRLSKKRTGTNNPCTRKKILRCSFSKEEVREFAVNLLESLLDTPLKSLSIPLWKGIDEQFPDFACLFADIKVERDGRGFNKKNFVIADILGITVEKWQEIMIKRRGEIISNSQMKNLSFRSWSSGHAASLTSSWKISKTQLRLYSMVLAFDPEASMEKKININGTWRSYDIWSPLLGAVIEMHGRVWHDPKNTKQGIAHICSSNFVNDEIKKNAALASGFQYLVFWDDQEPDWKEQLREAYGKNN